MEQAAISVLKRAVLLDESKRYTEALICYQEGVELLMTYYKGMTSGSKKLEVRKKLDDYVTRAEKIKELIQVKKNEGNYQEEIRISDNATGYSYESVMGRFMDSSITAIEIADPYIRSVHQIFNFLHFCELAVKKCENLKNITLKTTVDKSKLTDQSSFFESLSSDLRNRYNIHMEIVYSETLHDRQIVFSNGWVIQIGRGLDYFKPPLTKNGLGKFDLHFRPCRETNINIYHTKNVKKL